MKEKENGELPKMSIPKTERERPNLATELWFRKDDAERLVADGLLATVRNGDRTAETHDPKGGYRTGDFVKARIQMPDGSFDDARDSDILVIETQKMRLADLKEEDLADAPPDEQSKEALVRKLSSLYGTTFDENTEITVVRFRNAARIEKAADLIEGGALRVAQRPQNNPESIDAFPAYTLPLIAEDYPAKTAAMWNAAYEAFGINAGNVMLVGDPAHTKEILGALKRDGKYVGGGAGVGFKDEAVNYVDALDPLAKVIGSINFILKTENDELKGFNTDGEGYAEGLEELFKERGETLQGKKAVVLGAGGTGNSVAFALRARGMRVTILNRTVAKAADLSERINKYFAGKEEDLVRTDGEDAIPTEIRDAAVIVNVSTKGAAGPLEQYSALAPAEMPATPENIAKNLQLAADHLALIPKEAVVSDINILEKPTPLLQAAKEHGFVVQDGVPMVINQGVEAFWIAHGKTLAQKGISKEDVRKVMQKAAFNQ
jgi:shikimate dehydrogenase